MKVFSIGIFEKNTIFFQKWSFFAYENSGLLIKSFLVFDLIRQVINIINFLKMQLPMQQIYLDHSFFECDTNLRVSICSSAKYNTL